MLGGSRFAIDSERGRKSNIWLRLGSEQDAFRPSVAANNGKTRRVEGVTGFATSCPTLIRAPFVSSCPIPRKVQHLGQQLPAIDAASCLFQKDDVRGHYQRFVSPFPPSHLVVLFPLAAGMWFILCE